MKRIVLLVAILALALVGCSDAAATPTFTPAARVTWTPSPGKPVAAATSTSAPTQAASNVPSTPTIAPTNTSIPTSTPTVAPSATPSSAPVLPAGLFINNLRVEPNPPTRGTDLFFYATFVNNTSTVQNFKWLVYIYKPETPNKSFSETTAGLTAIATGTGEYKSLGSWKIALGGPCENYFARVAWFDENNKAINFTQPDGSVYEKTFTVCAPVDLPPGTPVPTPTATPTPTFAPGLFVMDIVTDPDPPKRGQDLGFIVTVANTIGTPQNYKWNAYIYRPGEKNSFGETTATTSSFGIGINDYHSSGFWKLPLGGPCETFNIRIGWFDTDRVRFFTTFDNQTFEKPITICPP